METQLQSQLFERVEPAVAAFAAAGVRRWRTKPVDVPLLCSLPSVKDQLASLGAEAEADADAQRDAIELAVEAAIKSLPNPFYDAALDHFGFTNTATDEKPLGKVEREERAVVHLGRTSQRWYVDKGRSSEYHDKTPSEYVIALVACALCGIPDPIAFLAEQHASPADAVAVEPWSPEEPRAGALRRGPRTRVVAAAVAATLGIVVAAWAIWGSGGGGSDANVVPPPGSAVDAQTGKVSPANSLPAHPAATSGQLGAGRILHACVVRPTGCVYPLKGQPMMAAPGDVLHIDLVLHNPEPTPVSEAKISVAVMPEVASGTMTATYEWPNGGINSAGIETIFSYPLMVSFTDHKAHSLRYVDGSSLLYPSYGEGHLLAHLPDGIVSEGGIILTDIGAPKSCWDCDLTYIRYVVFSMRVV